MTLLMLIGLSPISQAELVVTEASIHLSPMSSIPSAGYMTIQNKSQNEISIQALSSDHFEKVEWHETVISTDGIAKMRMKKKPGYSSPEQGCAKERGQAPYVIPAVKGNRDKI